MTRRRVSIGRRRSSDFITVVLLSSIHAWSCGEFSARSIMRGRRVLGVCGSSGLPPYSKKRATIFRGHSCTIIFPKMVSCVGFARTLGSAPYLSKSSMIGNMLSSVFLRTRICTSFVWRDRRLTGFRLYRLSRSVTNTLSAGLL